MPRGEPDQGDPDTVAATSQQLRLSVDRVTETLSGLQIAESSGLDFGDGRFRLGESLASELYNHQVEGVRWLWGLHEAGRGGILADDMG